MRPEAAKDGVAVQGRGTDGFLSKQPNGWDVITASQRFQSVDLSEWEPQDSKPPVRSIRSADRIRPVTKEESGQ